MSPSRDPSSAALYAFAAGLVLLAAHVAGRATRDALFLSNFPVTLLPRAMITASVASLSCTALLSRLLARSAPVRVIPPLLVSSGALFSAEWLLVGAAPQVGAAVVYLHVASLGAVLVSGFWSVVSERFDPHGGRTVVARVSGFAALGGVLGGLAAQLAAPAVGVRALLVLLAGLHLGAAACVWGVGDQRPRASPTPPAEGPGSGLRLLVRTPFLLQMASLVALLAIIEALLDYALKSEATHRFADEAALLRFFALFYTLTGLAAFLIQAGLGRRTLRSLGLGGAMALLPAAVSLTGAGAALFTRLSSVALARGATTALGGSLFRAGFELLYTPIPIQTKRPTKAYVDVGAQRLGEMMGGGLILVLLFSAPWLPTRTFVLLAVAGALGALLLVARLQRAYVGQLADKLRAGAIALEPSEALDATTARTLAETSYSIDRAEVLARIREIQATRPDAVDAAAGPGLAAETSAPRQVRDLIDGIEALESGDPERIRAALAAGRGDARLLPHALPRLDRFDVLDDVLAFLRELAPGTVGQLTDALADPRSSVLVRRRIPRVLEVCPGRRALDGLWLGLEDPDFEVRVQCARAAARIVERDPSLELPPALVHAAAERELGVGAWTWEQQSRRRAEDTGASVLLEGGAAGPDRSVEHVFTVLSLAHGTDMMGCALRALFGADPHLRGTALEYLQITLPDSVRSLVWKYVPTDASPARPRRPAAQLADELLRTSTALRRPRDPGV